MKKRAASDDEKALWRAVTHDVKPLARPRRIRAVAQVEAAPALPPAPPARIAKPAKPAAIVAPPPKPAVQKPNPGLDRATEAKFRSGKMTIAARLDLHGQTQREAHGELLAFLESSVRHGRRCVLVITGKGPGSPSQGILKRAVPRWIASSSVASQILATVTAQPKHGGDGALYVLLRRKRD
ncbi:MAG: mismatch repair protein MutS [Rhodospirillales bacterium]|nr:mismatch repair protein MutS [Rhodospirillales bacterium]